MKKTLFMMLLLSFVVLEGQTVRTARHIILDIDGGVDDTRACVAFLSSPDTEVMCITTTDGILSGRDAAYRACRMLSYLGHEGIPVASSRDTTYEKSWINAVCNTAYCGRDKDTTCSPSVHTVGDVMSNATLGSPKKAIIVACGPLTNVANFIRDYPLSSMRIEEIIWSSRADDTDYNLTADTAAYNAVVKSGIPLRAVCAGECVVDEKTLSRMYEKMDTPYGMLLSASAKSVYPHRPPLSDLCTMLYIYYPQFFDSENRDGVLCCSLSSRVREKDVLQAIKCVMEGSFYKEGQMYDGLPDEERLFYDDVRDIKDSVISRYGHSEWRASVITGELHGHLGVYAIVGVKMGQRAREYMGVGIDDVKIESYTHTSPPQSCMNDGLQVSTGGTLGHGLINVDCKDSVCGCPKARFTYGGKDILIALKPSVQKEIDDALMQAVIEYGLCTDDYWDRVRELALYYMVELDRREIFDIKNLREDNI